MAAIYTTWMEWITTAHTGSGWEALLTFGVLGVLGNLGMVGDELV